MPEAGIHSRRMFLQVRRWRSPHLERETKDACLILMAHWIGSTPLPEQ
jgi:hypothetical protein